MRTILNIFRPYNGIDILKLPFPEELCEKTFVVLYVLPKDYLQKLVNYTSEFTDRVRSHKEKQTKDIGLGRLKAYIGLSYIIGVEQSTPS